MKQKQNPPPSPDDKKDDPLGGTTRKMPEMPQIDDTLTKLDKVLEDLEKNKKKKLMPPVCCGILPCKGRTPFCFQCDLCMDCITGAGCSHDNSRHSFSNAVTGGDD